MGLDVIIQYITLAGVLLAVYKMFFKQGEGSKLADAEQKGKIALLKEQLASANKMNLKLIEENTNHIHTLDEGIKENRDNIQSFALGLEKLTTIINERIPKKE